MINLNWLFRKKIIVVLMGIAILLVIINLLVKNEPLKVVDFEPKNLTDLPLNQKFQFTFNRNLPDNLTVKTVPEFALEKTQAKETLTIDPSNNLISETGYIINILSDQQEIFKLTFTTKKLSESENVYEDTKRTLELYPLINYLPQDNDRYHLTYSAPLTLKITLKKGDQQVILKEVTSWVASKNIDPKTHTFTFK